MCTASTTRWLGPCKMYCTALRANAIVCMARSCSKAQQRRRWRVADHGCWCVVQGFSTKLYAVLHFCVLSTHIRLNNHFTVHFISAGICCASSPLAERNKLPSIASCHDVESATRTPKKVYLLMKAYILMIRRPARKQYVNWQLQQVYRDDVRKQWIFKKGARAFQLCCECTCSQHHHRQSL